MIIKCGIMVWMVMTMTKCGDGGDEGKVGLHWHEIFFFIYGTMMMSYWLLFLVM